LTLTLTLTSTSTWSRPWSWTSIDSLIFDDASARLHQETRWKGPLEMKLSTGEIHHQERLYANWLAIPHFWGWACMGGVMVDRQGFFCSSIRSRETN
jgi:hypothetical protein